MCWCCTSGSGSETAKDRVCVVCVCFVLGQIIHEETNNNENILKDQETVVFSLYLHQSN